MARGRKKPPAAADAARDGHPAPHAKAAMDSAAFLRAAAPVLKVLIDDLARRAEASADVSKGLEDRYQQEYKEQRTADSFFEWRRHVIEQVAAAWLLSCVFVRTLEDRGLLSHGRIAGPGAADSQRLFTELAPSLTDREYFLTVFRELGRLPGGQDIFDAKRNPVWKLAPSAIAAQRLKALFCEPSVEAPAFCFGQTDTRFLGDLYQDLSEAVRKRYALLQTPDFVERFILDRTLERAVAHRGVDDTTVIDPTCGSGHFLLGAFARLYEHWQRAQPGLSAPELALRALHAVYGADINPYAVAIARFRLILAVIEKVGYRRLAKVPKLPLQVVVADSLLHNPQHVQKSFMELAGQSAAVWGGKIFALEDEQAAREVLGRRYAAVVGNPPYITVKDAVLRERYRRMYPSCHRSYSVAVPFTERFFQLARPTGFVGMITANSFMKREFGKKLIEEYLPTVNLDLIINTSGAYIPGHGTPTVMLFGSHEPSKGTHVHTVLAKRGEPSTPEAPEKGEVWRSIAENWDQVGFDNEFISIARMERSSLRKHPWSLGGGGAMDLKQLLEEKAKSTLQDIVDVIGFVCMTRADDIYFTPRDALLRAGVRPQHIIENVEGERVRDWAIINPNTTLFPYDEDLSVTQDEYVKRFLWPYRTILWTRREPNGDHKEIGLTWWEWSRFQRERFQRPLSIAFAFVATHNHFVLDRGGKVFKQSAPIIKLPENATEDDHLALLAYLNSSTACFWMKQVVQVKQMTAHDSVRISELAQVPREYSGTALSKLPLPELNKHRSELIAFGRQLAEWGTEMQSLEPAALLRNQWSSSHELSRAIHDAEAKRTELLARMVALQDDLDWFVYRIFALADDSVLGKSEPLAPGSRPFEVHYGENHHASKTIDGFVIPDRQSIEKRNDADLQMRRLSAISSELALLETPDFKRRWIGNQGKFNRNFKTHSERAYEAAESELLEVLEASFSSVGPETVKQFLQRTPARALVMIEYVSAKAEQSAESIVATLMRRESVPFLSVLRYSASGLEKYAAWEECWALQRQEDAGQDVGQIAVPPKYIAKDFKEGYYWSLRGKLDVPKERFISYPGCESEDDGEPLYGWAGWNHLQRAQALAVLYQQRKQQDGWPAERLVPMLAGLLELIPWLKQWHNEPDPAYDGLRMGDYFAGFVESQCTELGIPRDSLTNYRPPAPTRRT